MNGSLLFGIVTISISLILTFLTVKFGIPSLIIYLGGIEKQWNPFRTLPPPGEMYVMVKGSPQGPFAGVIESVIDHEYDPKKHEFNRVEGALTSISSDSETLSSKSTSEKDKVSDPDYLEDLGVAFVGFYRYRLCREVRYDKWEKLPNSTEMGLIEKVHKGPSIFFQWNMATEVKGAETTENFPVNAIIVFTVQIKNPAKAFFFAGGWEVQVMAAIQGLVREYVGTKSIDGLRLERDEKGHHDLVDKIKELSENDGDKKGLKETFGVVIIDAKFVSYDLVSGDEEMRDATRAVGIAEERANALVKTANGEKRAAIERSEGIIAERKARTSVEGWQTLELAEALRVTRVSAIGGNIMSAISPSIPPEKTST